MPVGTTEEQLAIIVKAVNEASTVLSQVKSDLGTLDKAVATSAKGMKGVSQSISSLSPQLKSVGTGLTAGVTLPLVLLAKTAIKTAAQFEQSMANAFSVMGDVTDDTKDKLTDFAEQLGRDTAFRASEAADAMYKLASAGLNTQQIIGTLPGVLDLAAATQADLANVAEQASVAMRVFGIEAEDAQRITDSFAAGIANSNLNFERITESMKFAGPAMAAFGKTVEETTAALGVFANAGVLGSRAGTALRGILSRLADPTAEMKTVFTELGIAIEDVNPATKDLGQIFDELQKSGADASQVFRAFGKIAAGSVLAVLNSAESQGKAVSEVLLELEEVMGATGTASKIAADQLDTLAGAWKILGSSIENVFIQFKEDVFGDTLKTIVAGLINMANAIAGLPAPVKKFIVALLGIAALVGPIMLLTVGINSLVTSFIALAPAIGLAASALLPWVVGIAAAVFAIKKLYEGLTEVEDERVKAYNERLKQERALQEKASKEKIDALQDEYNEIESRYNKHVDNMENELAAATAGELQAQAEKIKEQRINDLRARQELIKQQIAYARAEGLVYDAKNGQVISKEKAFFKDLWQTAKAGGKLMIGIVSAIAQAIISTIGEMLLGIGRGVKTTITNIGESLKQLFKGNFEEAKDAAKSVLTDLGKGAIDTVKNVGSNFDNIAQGLVSSFQDAMKTAGDTTEEFDFAGEVAKITKEIDTKLGKSLAGLGEDAEEGAAGASSMGDSVKDLGKDLKNLGVFSVKAGNQMFGSFSTAEEGLELVQKSLTDVDTQFVETNKTIAGISDDIKARLLESFTVPSSSLQSLNDVDEVLKDIKTEVDKIVEAHDKWLKDTQTDLDNYDKKLADINDKFDAQAQSAREAAATDAAEQYISALERIKEVSLEIADADATRANALRTELSELQKFTKEFEKVQNQSVTIDFDADIEKVRAKLEEATSQAQTKKLEQELAILLGKQNIFVEERAKLEEAIALQKAEQQLSELDFIAFKLGKELEAVEAKRQAELKAAEDMKKIQEAIIAGTLMNLDLGKLEEQGFSAEALAFAEDSQLKEEAYRQSLQQQLDDLEEYESQVKTIYSNMTNELIQQQQTLETYTTLSLDRLISKYNQMAQAAREAIALQRQAASGGAMTGGRFASGGYTGAGNKTDVAGVVHKGEWVAPKWMVNSFRPLFNRLENMRIGKVRGFETGGYTGGNTTTNKFSQPITMHNNIREAIDMRSAARFLQWQLRRQ